MANNEPGLTSFGKIISYLFIFLLFGVGIFVLIRKNSEPKPASAVTATTSSNSPKTDSEEKSEVAEFIDPQTETPHLPAPGTYSPKDNVVEIELSEYAGYAGLIAANGGLEPTENSFFFKKHGFKLKITLSEEESWPALNTGKMAASATTADVLAVYGRQFQVVVPAQIGFSRGADGVVVRDDIKRINALKGQRIVASQFTESDFFIRYLAQEAGVGIHMLPHADSPLDPEKVNLLYAADSFQAGDLFLKDRLKGGELAGCVSWEPKTSEIVAQSEGKARLLTSNRNLLIIADILIVNRGFATEHPAMVSGLVHGLIEGNRMVRDNPEPQLDIIGKAFQWDHAKTRSELEKVHLSNLPENLAFFSGEIDAAGSFGGIYQSAVYAYGSDLLKDPADPSRFVDLQYMQTLQKGGEYAAQKVAIAPIRSSNQPALEENPLLSRDIRFYFLPNAAKLEAEQPENLKNLEDIKRMLQVSPGSTILLRGHVDNALVGEFRKQGGEAFVRKMALGAMELSRNRATEVRQQVVTRFGVDAARIECVGRGWEEPAGTDSDKNRRVEVQWFTIE